MSRRQTWVAVAALVAVGLVVGGIVLTKVAFAGPRPFGWGHWTGWAGKAAHEQAGWPFADLAEGRPVTLGLTPGTVTAATTSSLTVQVKDGQTTSFGIDAQTHLRGTPAVGDRVIVITRDGGSTAAAILSASSQYAPRSGGWQGGWRGGWSWWDPTWGRR